MEAVCWADGIAAIAAGMASKEREDSFNRSVRRIRSFRAELESVRWSPNEWGKKGVKCKSDGERRCYAASGRDLLRVMLIGGRTPGDAIGAGLCTLEKVRQLLPALEDVSVRWIVVNMHWPFFPLTRSRRQSRSSWKRIACIDAIWRGRSEMWRRSRRWTRSGCQATWTFQKYNVRIIFRLGGEQRGADVLCSSVH